MTSVDPASTRDEVHADLLGWAQQYPVFNPVRFPALALTTAVHLPDRPRPERALAALVSLWVIAFDDLVDEGRLTGPALRALAADFVGIVRGEPDRARPCPRAVIADVPSPAPGAAPSATEVYPDSAQHGQALREIARRVVAYAPPAPLMAYWRETFQQMVDGIIVQREMGALLRSPGPPVAGRAVPTYEDLIDMLAHSVGVQHYLATCFIVSGDSLLAERLPSLRPAVTACARAIRLANDLRTWQKDEREGGISALTAVRAELMRAHPGLSWAECQAGARRLLAGRLDAEVAQTHELLAASPCPRGAVERGIARLVEFVPRFYASHDYHTYRPA